MYFKHNGGSLLKEFKIIGHIKILCSIWFYTCSFFDTCIWGYVYIPICIPFVCMFLFFFWLFLVDRGSMHIVFLIPIRSPSPRNTFIGDVWTWMGTHNIIFIHISKMFLCFHIEHMYNTNLIHILTSFQDCPQWKHSAILAILVIGTLKAFKVFIIWLIQTMN